MDFQGLKVTGDTVLIAALDKYVLNVLSYGQGWNCIVNAVAASPKNVLAHVYAGDFYIAKGDFKLAGEHFTAAAALPVTTPREGDYVVAFQQLMQGQLLQAYGTFKAILTTYPADLFALKRAQLMAFVLGQPTLLLEVASLPEVAIQNATAPFYHGCLAFALEQNGQGEACKSNALRGLQQQHPQFPDVWCHHAYAHATYQQGELQAGLQFMLQYSDVWTNCMSFMYTHNWFHVVLFYVDLNDVDKVCDTFDTHLWHVLSDQKKHQLAAKTPLTDQFRQNDKHDPQDQLSALLTLWFLEMRCAMLGENSIERRQWLDDRWSGVLEYVSFPTAHNDRLFDLCVLQGLHQTQAVDQTVEHEQGLQVVGGEDAKVINPLAEAIRLLHIPSPNSPPGKEAVELLTGVLGQLTAPPSCIGGSDEQRSVIWELFLYALFVAGEQVELKARVTVLEDARPNIPARVQLLQQLNTTTSS